MTRILQFTIAILSVTAMATTASDISVTSTISDYDPSGTAYYVQSDGLNGGVYPNGQTGVQSILQSTASYSWELSTFNSTWSGSSGRNGLITLNPAVNQASCSGCTAATTPPSVFTHGWGTYLEPVRFIEKCFYLGVNMLAIKPGSPQSCPVDLRFGPDVGSGKNTSHYLLSMVGPNLCKECVNEPETQYVQVSCNAQDASGNCNDWSFDSIPPTSQSGGVPTSRVIARLNQTNGGSGGTNEGDFYLTFHIHVTNP